MLLSGFVALALTSIATAHVPARHVAHEVRRSLPIGWTPVKRADPGLVLPLSIGLVQSNLDNLEGYLMDIADPDSPNYSNHWTPAAVADTFRPSEASVDAVRAWLIAEGNIEAGRVALSRSGGWMNANVTVEEAERLLGTEYFVYEHAEGGMPHVACAGAYHLPAHVAPHVDIVTPTLHFDVKAVRHGASDLQSRAVAKNVGSVGFGASPQTGGKVNVSDRPVVPAARFH